MWLAQMYLLIILPLRLSFAIDVPFGSFGEQKILTVAGYSSEGYSEGHFSEGSFSSGLVADLWWSLLLFGGSGFWFDVCVDVYFLCDIFVNFRTAFYDSRGVLVIDQHEITRGAN
jgi:hypothetical protein